MKNASELESRLTELLDAQSRTVLVSDRTWSDESIAFPVLAEGTGRSRRARHFVVAAVGIAALTALAIGVSGSRSEPGQRVRTRPPATPVSAHSVSWSTKQVALSADDFSIVADGTTYTSAGAQVDVSSDPGDPTYQTLELTWYEHGTEMRWYIYFASDGTDWWATEMRTYNGHEEWITYPGDRFRTARGAAFTGDLDLATVSGGVPGELHVHGLRLQAFLRPAVCAAGGPAVVVDSPLAPLDFEEGGANALILDSVTCTPVADQRRYRVDWVADDPSIVNLQVSDDCGAAAAGTCAPGTRVGVSAHPGTTTVHLNLIEVATGQMVATTTVPGGLGNRAPRSTAAESTTATVP